MKPMYKENLLVEFLVDNSIATRNEVQLAISLCGFTEDVLLTILYIRTGYHTIAQASEEMYVDDDLLSVYGLV